MYNFECAEAPALEPITNDNDILLVEKLRRGNTEAFNVLVERHWARIFSRVYSLVDNLQDAEEITQDTFTRAYHNIHQFRGEAAFSTWIFQIASNLARNRYWYWRRRGKGCTVSIHQPIQEGEGCWEELIAEEGPGIIGEITFAEKVRAIQEKMPELQESYREILDLRLKDELSYDKMAEVLELPVGTVKSRLARARKALADSLVD